MNRQLKRILDLVRRTGDRMVVTDPDGEEAYVIMGLEQYEEILEAVEHHHHAHALDEEEDDEAWVPEWKPEDYGDLVATEPEAESRPSERVSEASQADDLPGELKQAVEHDLAILEAWRQETENAAGLATPEKSDTEPKNDDDEERFYLEPIE